MAAESGATLTLTSLNWSNQNCCSLTIWYSSTRLPAVLGAMTDTGKVVVAPAARSAARLKRWSVYQVLAPKPPPVLAKWTPRWTGLGPPAGQLWVPVLVTERV